MEQQRPHKVLQQAEQVRRAEQVEQQRPHKVLQQAEQVRRAGQLEQELPHNPHLATSGETKQTTLEQV